MAIICAHCGQENPDGVRMCGVCGSTLVVERAAKSYLGDPTGAEDEQRALDLAIELRSSIAGSIANNISVIAFFAFEHRRAEELTVEGLRIAESVGDVAGLRWMRGQMVSTALLAGRWDEALAEADGFILECEAGSPHYLESSARDARARIREGRGDAEGALADSRRSVELARGVNDPQQLLAELGLIVSLLEIRGQLDEAREIARELVAMASLYPQDAAWTLALEFVFSPLAREFESELRATLESAPYPRWKEVALACLDRDFVGAADLWGAAGGPTWEARLRIRAAEELIETGRRAEGETQIELAAAFHRTVGATYWIERGEAL